MQTDNLFTYRTRRINPLPRELELYGHSVPLKREGMGRFRVNHEGRLSFGYVTPLDFTLKADALKEDQFTSWLTDLLHDVGQQVRFGSHKGRGLWLNRRHWTEKSGLGNLYGFAKEVYRTLSGEEWDDGKILGVPMNPLERVLGGPQLG